MALLPTDALVGKEHLDTNFISC